MSSGFLEVFDHLSISPEHAGLISAAKVVKIVMTEDRRSVTVYLRSPKTLSRECVAEVSEAIRTHIFSGKEVNILLIDVEPHPQEANNARNGGSAASQSGSRSAKSGAAPAGKEAKPGQQGYKRAVNQWTPKQDKKSDNPDVIYGYDFKGEALKIKTLEEGMGAVIVNGFLFGTEEVKTKNGKYIIKFNLSDKTDSISCRLFCDENEAAELSGELKTGRWISLSGEVTPPDGKFNTELTIGRIRGIRRMQDPTAGRMDRMPEGEKRVELHLHTKMSDMDAVGDVSSYIKRASDWGWEALAITDHNSVQVFPQAAHAIPKGSKLRLLLGMEGRLVDDEQKCVTAPRGQKLSDCFVVFDIETTGFSPVKNRIIEIGAVKIENGRITDRFSQFVDPKEPIPYEIQKLTGITDREVMGQGGYERWIPAFLDFCGDAVIVAHNAKFDTTFIGHFAKELGFSYAPTIIDTVGLSRMLLPKLNRFKLDTVAKELGITLENHHRAVDDAEATAGIFLKLCERLRQQDIFDLDTLYEREKIDVGVIGKLPVKHVTVFAKNDLGRTNLYRLISAAHVEYFNRQPRIPKSLLRGLRDGLLIGSGCQSGELYDALMRGVGEAEAEEIASFYDYLEVLPPDNLMYLTLDEKSTVKSREDIVQMNSRIIRLGEKLGKPVCAVGDVHFPEEGDAVYRQIIKYFDKSIHNSESPQWAAPCHLRTTEEMLSAFREYDAETARKIVIENPKKIVRMCEPVAPVRPDKCPPVIENSDQLLRDICNQKAHEMYGPELPEEVSVRLNKELDSIISNGYSVMYIIAQKLVWDSNDHGYLVGSRGSVGSSLVATMAGISEVNPLPPHYRCPKCFYTDFHSETVKEYADKAGCDMPDAVCPVCGAPLIKDGFDIPFETFLGFKGDKEPDIDLNFAGDYQAKAHAYTEVIFGKGQTYKAGTIGTVQDKTAYGYVLRYNDDHEIRGMRRAEVERIAMGCTEVRRTTGQHPGGIIVLPHGEEISSFTPIQHPANDMNSPITTHFDYHSIDHNLLKLDILGKDDPSMVRMLQDMTGLDPMDIPIGVPEVMSLFQNTEALGLTPDDIGGTKCGTLGIPEFGTDFAIQMLLDAKPKYVSDLVRIAGLAHGTDVWVGNAQKLINEGKCTIQTAICTRDDIMIYLITKGLPPGDAFSIMELVRKGKFPKNPKHEEYCEMMRAHGVPDWYIWSCDTIKYMFPKAHAAAYVVMSSRIAYYKIHYPAAYYAAYYTVKGKGFDYEKMCVTLPKLRQNLKTVREYIANNRDATANDKLLYRDMRIVEEMMARGIEFVPIDIFRAKAREFQLVGEKIMPALNSIAGLGDNAADAIEREAKNGPYLSVEEFIARTKVTKTNADLLKELGLLGSIPDSNQLSIFDLS